MTMLQRRDEILRCSSAKYSISLTLRLTAHSTCGRSELQLTGALSNDAPKLFIRKVGGKYELSWSAAYNNWSLRHSAVLAGANWGLVPEATWIDSGWNYVQTPATPANRFFQLTKP